MDSVLIKIFAAALTFSQVATAPETKTHFDPIQDQQQVAALLHSGCERVRRAFDIEALNVDDLIATAMDDPEAVAAGHAVFRGIDVGKLHVAYRQFCKNEAVAEPAIDLAEVIEFYNRTLLDLPDHSNLKDAKLPGASVVLDLKGQPLGEVYEQDQRRIWVPLADIPKHVQQAFIAAEDKRFYEHKGVDERALIRAFLGNLTKTGRPQGGSTITQQVVKNLLTGEDVTYERKIREMVLASRIEGWLTKSEILELYLNSVYMGRAASGVEMAARSYFGKPARELTLGEGALLAGLTKGPNAFSPERYPDRAKERFRYVLDRMQEDGMITAEEAGRERAAFPNLVRDEKFERPPGSYFASHVARELRTASDLSAFRVGSYNIQSTLHPDVQRAAELALQEGLARYEMSSGRVEFQGPETNLAQAISHIEAETASPSDKPAWQQALESARWPVHDVQWKAAVMIEQAAPRRGGGSLRVGLADGRVLPLQGNAALLRTLKLYDVVLVRVTEGRGGERAELRVRPVVQGAAVVIENKTGRILAMTGGFSYALSQLNRVVQSQRQPGSALKPLTYLAALQKGLQPNTLVRDEDITLPPLVGKRQEDYWSPKNYEGGSSGIITLRAALENSRNLATVNLLEGGIAATAPASLDRICSLAVELQIYKECARHYPFVLGAQPVRPIDLALFYATIANEGRRPSPYAIEAIEQNGNIVYRRTPSLTDASPADRASFYQLKAMLQGVLQRGTARRIASLAPYVAGKTGTTQDENDAWFVGFTNEVTVAVWVGYDNADGARRTLGGGRTGANVAVPIFEPIIQAVWTHYAPRTLLDPPSPEALSQLVAVSADRGSRDGSRRGALVEYLRRDANGRPVNARNDFLLSRSGSVARDRRPPRRQEAEGPSPPGWDGGRPGQSPWAWGGWGGDGGWGGRERRDPEPPRYSPYERRDSGSPYERRDRGPPYDRRDSGSFFFPRY